MSKRSGDKSKKRWWVSRVLMTGVCFLLPVFLIRHPQTPVDFTEDVADKSKTERLTWRLIDLSSEQPLSGVLVTLKGVNLIHHSALSDAQGRVQFHGESRPAAAYDLRIEAEGYEPLAWRVKGSDLPFLGEQRLGLVPTAPHGQPPEVIFRAPNLAQTMKWVAWRHRLPRGALHRPSQRGVFLRAELRLIDHDHLAARLPFCAPLGHLDLWARAESKGAEWAFIDRFDLSNDDQHRWRGPHQLVLGQRLLPYADLKSRPPTHSFPLWPELPLRTFTKPRNAWCRLAEPDNSATFSTQSRTPGEHDEAQKWHR